MSALAPGRAAARRLASRAVAASLLVPATLAAQRRGPILDMHMHAREAAHYGPTGLPLCAPVERMPRWDQRHPLGEDPDASPLCARPLVSPTTDSALLRQTVAMVWPGLIDAAVRGIDEATYLTPAQRRGILYDNAAPFLRLTPEQIARHHGRAP